MMRLLQLAQELQWQTLQVQRAGGAEAIGLRIEAGEPLEARRDAVLATTDKIQRELLSTVRFDPLRLVGVGGPIDATLDTLGDLLVALDEIRRSTVTDAGTLPASVRSFQGMLQSYCDDGAPAAA